MKAPFFVEFRKIETGRSWSEDRVEDTLLAALLYAVSEAVTTEVYQHRVVDGRGEELALFQPGGGRTEV